MPESIEHPLVFHEGNWKLLVAGEPNEYQYWPMSPINSHEDILRDLNLQENREYLFKQAKELNKELEKLFMNEERINEIINHEWSDQLSLFNVDIENNEIELELKHPEPVVSFNKSDVITLARYFELTPNDLTNHKE